MLPSNEQGLPDALLTSDTAFAAAFTKSDIDVSSQRVKIRYVVDRLCTAAGIPTTANCSMSDDPVPLGSSSSEGDRAEDPPTGGAAAAGAGPAVSRRVVYRVSVRVSGPRDTQAFFQTTLTPP